MLNIFDMVDDSIFVPYYAYYKFFDHNDKRGYTLGIIYVSTRLGFGVCLEDEYAPPFTIERMWLNFDLNAIVKIISDKSHIKKLERKRKLLSL